MSSGTASHDANRPRGSPALPNGKASAAPPKLTEDGMEMEDRSHDQRPPLPIEEDLMQLARLGEVAAIQNLFDSGKYDARSTDQDGITALHVCGEGSSAET